MKPGSDSGGVAEKWAFQLLTVAPEMSWISFEIFRPDDGIKVETDTTDWALEISSSPISSKSIDIAKQWIRDCLNIHSPCSRADLTPLPTRVIDVGLSDETSNPRLFVSNGQTGQYVTLSHCWGTSYRVTLTKNNLPKFQQSIKIEKLPKTFQDAIQLTRKLGIQYL